MINRLKKYFKSKKEIKKFKTEIWQTDELSRAFIEGTKSTVPAADIMDKEVNTYFLSQCRTGDVVLDIGCGHGVVSEYLLENGMNVTAVDISEKLLDEFRSRIKNKKYPVKIIRADAYNLPLLENEFDVVVARMFLPHFRDWPVVLKEMVRVTKPGGKLLIHFSSKENNEIGQFLGKKYCTYASSPDTEDPWKFYAETDMNELNKVQKKLNIKLINRIPVSFFMHNRILGNQLGTDQYNVYMSEIQDYMKNPTIKEFIIWFDREVIGKCNPFISHFNILHFEKNS